MSPLEFSSANMVLAWSLLIACWVVIALVIGYVAAAGKLLGAILPELDFGSSVALAIKAARLLLVLTGWVLLLVAFFRAEGDISVFGSAWVDTIMKAVATLPAAAMAALLTALIVVFLPHDNPQRKWLGVANVLGCLVATLLSFGGVYWLTVQFGPATGSSLPGIIYTLGYAPLLLVSALFLIAAVGLGFGASWAHRRAGGLGTTLFTVGLVTTYVLLERHGPLGTPLLEDPLTADIVRAELGLAGVSTLFLAGVLGIFFPSEDP